MTFVPPPAPPPAFDTQPNPETGFLGLYTEEDMGLKALLTGLTVTDLNAPQDAPRPVPVWFMNPEREERRITYPNITINFAGERVAHEREHRGWVQIQYHYLQNVPFDDHYPVFMDYPIPMDFDYVVTVSARINQHISQLSAALGLGILHPRFAHMQCPGGTARRVEVLSATRTNAMEADKRLFRQIYRVRVPTEIEDVVAISKTRVRQVILSIVEKNVGEVLFGPAQVVTTNAFKYNPSAIQVGQYQSQTAGE